MIFPKNFWIYPLISTLALAPLSAVSAETEKPQATQAATATSPETLPLNGLPKLWLQGTPVTEWEKDKVYIFEFWATWCGPCVAAMPHMEALHNGIQRAKLNAQVIGVNVSDRTTPERLKKFLARQTVPPTYAIAVDTEKATEQHWLRAQKVIGIPYAFALKNGKIIWKGHPQSLSGELIREMTQPDFVAPQARPEKSDEETPEVRHRAREISHLFSDGKVAEAEALLKAFLEDGTISDSTKISVMEAPCYAALRNREYRKMNAYLRRKAETFPKDFFNQVETAYFVLETDDVPVADRDFALAEECLNAALALTEEADTKSRIPAIYTMLAEIYAERGEKEAAKNARKLAWEHSREYQTQQRIRDKITTPDAENLYASLENGTATIPDDFFTRAEKKSSPWKSVAPTPSQSEETQKMLSFLSTLQWVQGEAPKSLPANSIALIDFWMPPAPGPFSPHFSQTPGKWLSRNLPEGYDLPVFVVALEQEPGRTKEILALPRYATKYPVGVISAETFAKTTGAELGIEGVPATFALRDGKIIWKGVAQKLPQWVIDAATQDNYDHATAQAERDEKLAQARIVNAKLMEVRRQIADKNYALAKETIAQIRPILDTDPGLDMRASEMLASIEYLNGNYKNVGKICTDLMNKYPNTEFIAGMQAKLINSNQDMRSENLPVLILSARNIIGSGTQYPSAYWEIIANLYAEMGDIRNAIYASFCARETSEYWQSYRNAQ